VGVNSLAVAVGEEPDTIEEVYEPYLIMEGLPEPHLAGPRRDGVELQKLGLRPNSGNQDRLL